MVKLRIVDDTGSHREVDFEEDEITIGRKDGNTIRLEERNVSRVHARLVREGDELFVEDAESSFGVRVNGIRVLHRTAIHFGDEIGIGDFVLGVIQPAEAGGFDAHAAGTVVSVVSIPDSVRAQLRIVSGDDDAEILQLEKTPTLLGSAEKSDIQVAHASVENEHALIYYRNGCYELEGVSESARIWVNGRRCTSMVLEHGDEFTLGEVDITFSESPATRMTARITEVAVSPQAIVPQKKLIIGVGVLLIACGVVFAIDYIGGDQPGDAPLPKEPVGVSFAPNELDNLDKDPTGVASGAYNQTGADENPLGSQSGDSTQVGMGVPGGSLDGQLVAGHLKDAKIAMSEKQWYEAIELYSIVLDKHPDHTDAKLKWERAKLELRRERMIEQIDDLVAEKNYVRAWELVERFGNAIPPESIYHAEMIRRLLVVGELAGPAVLEKGKNALKREDFSVALQLSEQVLDMQPGNAEALLLRNDILQKQALSTRVQAKGVPRRGIAKKDPRSTKKLTGKERLKLAEKRYQEGRKAQLGGRNALAITKHKEALRAQRRYYKAHKQLGILYAARGDSVKAIRHYKSYIKDNPKAGDRKTVENAILRLGGSL